MLGKDRFECARTGLNTQFLIEGYERKLGDNVINYSFKTGGELSCFGGTAPVYTHIKFLSVEVVISCTRYFISSCSEWTLGERNVHNFALVDRLRKRARSSKTAQRAQKNVF